MLPKKIYVDAELIIDFSIREFCTNTLVTLVYNSGCGIPVTKQWLTQY